MYGAVLACGLALVALGPALSVFSLGNAAPLVLDLGASALLGVTVFLAAAVVASSANPSERPLLDLSHLWFRVFLSAPRPPPGTDAHPNVARPCP